MRKKTQKIWGWGGGLGKHVVSRVDHSAISLCCMCRPGLQNYLGTMELVMTKSRERLSHRPLPKCPPAKRPRPVGHREEPPWQNIMDELHSNGKDDLSYTLGPDHIGVYKSTLVPWIAHGRVLRGPVQIPKYESNMLVTYWNPSTYVLLHSLFAVGASVLFLTFVWSLVCNVLGIGNYLQRST